RRVISVFFFQAEDGIRDRTVTGVQTCALPISSGNGDTRNPVRPFLNPDFSGPIILGKPSQWFNPNAFLAPSNVAANLGFYGNVEIGRASCRERVWGWVVVVRAAGVVCVAVYTR